MTSCVTYCDKAKWVCGYTCVHESACVHVCFCMTSVGAFPFPCHQLKAKASSGPCFLPLFYKYKISFEEALITADAAKNLKSVLHTTTHNGSISRHIIPGTKTMIFTPEKVVLMTPNEGAAVWVTPQNCLLATPSCQRFITVNPHTTLVMLKTIWTNADIHFVKFWIWFYSAEDNSDTKSS